MMSGDAIEIWAGYGGFLDDRVHEGIWLQPIRALGNGARVTDAAEALRLAFFHSQHDFARAWIAADSFELCAENTIKSGRDVPRRAAA